MHIVASWHILPYFGCLPTQDTTCQAKLDAFALRHIQKLQRFGECCMSLFIWANDNFWCKIKRKIDPSQVPCPYVIWKPWLIEHMLIIGHWATIPVAKDGRFAKVSVTWDRFSVAEICNYNVRCRNTTIGARGATGPWLIYSSVFVHCFSWLSGAVAWSLGWRWNNRCSIYRARCTSARCTSWQVAYVLLSFRFEQPKGHLWANSNILNIFDAGCITRRKPRLEQDFLARHLRVFPTHFLDI